MKLNLAETLVLWVIVLCCVASAAHSFVNYVVPQSIQQQRQKMEPTLDMMYAFDLGPRR
jgi:hypothetical protein